MLSVAVRRYLARRIRLACSLCSFQRGGDDDFQGGANGRMAFFDDRADGQPNIADLDEQWAGDFIVSQRGSLSRDAIQVGCRRLSHTRVVANARPLRACEAAHRSAHLVPDALGPPRGPGPRAVGLSKRSLGKPKTSCGSQRVSSSVSCASITSIGCKLVHFSAQAHALTKLTAGTCKVLRTLVKGRDIAAGTRSNGTPAARLRDSGRSTEQVKLRLRPENALRLRCAARERAVEVSTYVAALLDDPGRSSRRSPLARPEPSELPLADVSRLAGVLGVLPTRCTARAASSVVRSGSSSIFSRCRRPRSTRNATPLRWQKRHAMRGPRSPTSTLPSRSCWTSSHRSGQTLR